MFTVLMLGSGIFWILTYSLIIWHGFREHTYGMPLVALGANLSWEFIFSFVLPHAPIQRTVNIVWFSLDLVILFQLLRYGPREFADLPKSMFFALVGLTLMTSFCTVLFVSLEFDDRRGAYAAFGQNLLMSVLFITMLYNRQSLRGQSLAIAGCKLVGTALASLAFYLYVPLSAGSVLLPFLYISIFFYDLIYVVLVYARGRVEVRAARE